MAATNGATVRAEDCLPQVEGELRAAGLEGDVRIVRDRWGVPHARAGSARDAFFAQGFCLGQERMWQIELYRQMAHGRAAALLNEGLLRIDRLNRRMGYGRDAAAEWEEQSDDARMILQAYADGVNAAIAAGPKPLEFHRLGHEMPPWSPVDSLAILKMVSANVHWSLKISNARLAAQLGVEAATALIPDVPDGGAMITPAGATWANGANGRHAWEDELRALAEEPGMRRGGADGSNCWVIDGAHTASGAPLVVGDPHLSLSVPAQWYLMHMECEEFSVAGTCSPGYPGPVYYGHNGRVAWTMTHAQGDRWDVYRERITRNGEPSAEFRGEQRPLQRRDEVIEVRGSEAVTETDLVDRARPGGAGRSDDGRRGAGGALRAGGAVPRFRRDAADLPRGDDCGGARRLSALRLDFGQLRVRRSRGGDRLPVHRADAQASGGARARAGLGRFARVGRRGAGR